MQTVNNNNTKLSVMMFVEWFIWGRGLFRFGNI